jgi:hypothetical protein
MKKRLGRGLNELSVGECVALNQAKNCIPEKERIVAVVEAPFKFIEVGGKMLDADLMVGADHGPLEQAPDVLDGVRVNVAPDPFFGGMIDGDMLCVGVPDALVADPAVRVDRCRSVIYDLVQEAMECSTIPAAYEAEPDLAASLNGSDDDRLVAAAVRPAAASGALAAVPSLIGLDDPGELHPVVGHRGADAMAEIPGGLIGDAQHPLQLVCANALLGLAHDVDGKEPLPQRQLRVVEDGADADAELVAAAVTIELPALDDPRDFVRVAARAADAVRPAQPFQVGVALVLAPEPFNQLRKVEFAHG